MTSVVATLGAVAPADLGRAVPLRSPLPGVHRPSDCRQRSRSDAGGRLVQGMAVLGMPSGSLRRIGGFPDWKIGVPSMIAPAERIAVYSQTTPSPSPSRMKR